MHIRSLSEAGLTLIEIMIVIAIGAVMAGVTVQLFAPSAYRLLQNESTHLMATIRYAYNEAASKNRVHRLVFNFDENQYWLEEGPDSFVLGLNQDEKKSATEDNETTAEPAGSFVVPEDSAAKKIIFEDVIKIRDIFVGHQEESLEAGLAYLYFFPNGMTEEALIHLSDIAEEINFSLIVNPITAKVRVEAEYIDVKEMYE